MFQGAGQRLGSEAGPSSAPQPAVKKPGQGQGNDDGPVVYFFGFRHVTI